MASALPTELIAKVVDEIALQPERESIQDLIAWSTVNSTFAPICQKHIFHTARFVPEPSKCWDDTGTEAKDLYRRTKLLSSTLIQNPVLGSYVKRIDFMLTAGDCEPNENLQNVFDALKSVPSGDVTQFTLASRPYWDGVHPYVFSTFTVELIRNAEWFRGIASAFHHLQFKVFRLLGVRSFPLETLPGSLESLHIERSSIWPHELELPHPRPFIRLKTLGFNGHDMPALVMKYLLGGCETQTFIDIRYIEIFNSDFRCYGMEKVIQSTVQLRELDISDGILLYQHVYQDPNLVLSALRKLNPSSFHTLSRITLDVHYSFDEGGEVLREPYAHICGPEFAQLVALQELAIHLVLYASDLHILLDNHGNYGSQWSWLLNLLATPGAFPLLRRVAIRVSILVQDNERGEGPGLANKIVENMLTFVYPAQFRSIDNLQSASGDLVDLSFFVEAVVYPSTKRVS